jgi:hypothetical protein
MRSPDALDHRLDTIGRRRMVDQEFLVAGQGHAFLNLDLLHEFEQTAGRHMRLFQVAHAGLVGRGLSGTAGHQIVADAHILADAQCAYDRARVVATDRGRACQDGCQQHRIGGVLHIFVAAHQMTAGDMAGFVGDDADDLERIVRLLQRAGVNEDILPAGDEGVELRAVDQNDMDVVRFQPGGDPNRRAECPQRLFDLGVAEQRRNVLRHGWGRQAKTGGDSRDRIAQSRIECQGSPRGVVITRTTE